MQKIVIVEDDKPIREMYEFKIKSAGYDVHTASDGLEGLSTVENVRPDLILLDIKMPIMNGDEMLKKLRETKWGSSVKVIILTNLSKDEAPAILKLLHVDRYVVKAHFTPTEIIDIIKEVL
ncbi:MAG: response regulator [Candidatus Saccharibacteria bacterium]